MKKVIFSVAVVATMVFAACSGEKKVQDEASSMQSKIENCTNPDSLKAYAAQAQAYYQKLVAEGKVDEAKAFLDKGDPTIKEKVPSLAGAFETLKSGVDALPGKVDDAASAAGDSISAAADQAQQAVADKAAETKAAAESKADEVKAKAADKAEEIKGKAADAVQQGADKLKDALGK